MVKANEGLSTNQISEERIPSSTNQYNIYIYTHVFLYLYIYNIYYEPHCVYIYIYMECHLLTGFPHRCHYTSGCFLHGFLSSPLPGGGRSLLGDTMITEVDVCDGAGLVGLVGSRIGFGRCF